MIYDKRGQVAVVTDEGKEIAYTIGDEVVATDQSFYSGLRGRIVEIRDGEDRETDNETPDIYCDFFQPEEPDERIALEERFGRLYGYSVGVSPVPLDNIIMAPSMIQKCEDEKMKSRKLEMPLNDTLLVGFDFTHGKDHKVLIVGKKRGKVLEIVNAFEGETAENVYALLTTKRERNA